MKFPDFTNASGIGTTGATGITLLVGVIWGQLNPWWLAVSIFLIISGIGQENRKQ